MATAEAQGATKTPEAIRLAGLDGQLGLAASQLLKVGLQERDGRRDRRPSRLQQVTGRHSGLQQDGNEYQHDRQQSDDHRRGTEPINTTLARECPRSVRRGRRARSCRDPRLAVGVAATKRPTSLWLGHPLQSQASRT